MASDGQVTLGDMVCKSSAKKVRSMSNGSVLVGFAGSVSDSLTFMSRLETKLTQYPNDLVRSVIELSKDWRSDKYLRHLETSMIVADSSIMMSIGGSGEAMEVEDDVASVGSGSRFALAAAYALESVEMDAESIARKAMAVASRLCVYTNDSLTIETITAKKLSTK